jgi:poly(3-hydroxybutyrate) depolymerase
MDADYYLETIKVVFQDFSLVSGTWDVKSPSGKLERVRPSAITTTALMSVEGELDDISGSGQTRAVHDICTGVVGGQKRHFEAKGAGHYGIFSGRRWRELVYPEVKAFIKGHQVSTRETKPVAPATPKVRASSAARPARAAKPTDNAPTLFSASAPAALPSSELVAPSAPVLEVPTTPLATPAPSLAQAAIDTAEAMPSPRPVAKTPARAVTKTPAKASLPKPAKTTKALAVKPAGAASAKKAAKAK